MSMLVTGASEGKVTLFYSGKTKTFPALPRERFISSVSLPAQFGTFVSI
jgi:hypothetical protein